MGLAIAVALAILATDRAVIADGSFEASVLIKLVTLGSPSVADALAVLLTPQAEFAIDQAFYVEMWSQTTDPNSPS